MSFGDFMTVLLGSHCLVYPTELSIKKLDIMLKNQYMGHHLGNNDMHMNSVALVGLMANNLLVILLADNGMEKCSQTTAKMLLAIVHLSRAVSQR